MTSLLADIGGTHARIAVLDNGAAVLPAHYSVKDFWDVASILDRYCKDTKVPPGGEVRIATAANPDPDGVWRFTNNKALVIDAGQLARAGWTLAGLVDDFVACAWGAIGLGSDRGILLRDGLERPGTPLAILGPGTGLGLAYMIPLADGCWHVQQTFGGHMLAAAATGEQRQVLADIGKLKEDGGIVVPEDMVSGRGLLALYRVLCGSEDTAPRIDSVPDLLKQADDKTVKNALRLFHEFLGLFAHNAMVSGHAYGGLYLYGGLIQALHRQNLLDFDSFETFKNIDAVAVVRQSVVDAPVWLADDPYLALHGLVKMQ